MKLAPRRIERVLLIVNPASRRGLRIRAKAMKAFADAAVACDVMLTEAPGHAAVIAKAHAHKYDAVFTLGGDGTVMEVLGALAHKGPPLGVLGWGPANVVAWTLRHTAQSPRAVPLLLSGDEATMDLGRLGDGRRFAIGVGVGLDATMISEAPARLKKRFGFMAYVIGGYKAVLRNQKFDLNLTVDGVVLQATTRRPSSSRTSAPSSTIWSRSATESFTTTGCSMRASSHRPIQRDALRILWRMVRKDFRADPCLFYKSGPRVPHRNRAAILPAQADGEVLPGTPLSVSVDPLAACLLLPKR